MKTLRFISKTLRDLTPLIHRAARSAAIWSWVFNGLRLSTAILLLPLLLRSLTSQELGIHYVLTHMLLLLPALDSAIAFNLVRFVGHAMSGAVRFEPQGLSDPPKKREPNYSLVWDLLAATRRIYRVLAAVVASLLLAYGCLVLSQPLNELESPAFAWLALSITVVGAACDIYWSWWGSFLRGMDRVLEAVRLQTLGYSIRLLLAVGLLFADLGLLSLPIANLVGSIVQRALVRRHCLRLLAPHRPLRALSPTGPILRALFPNSWRVGLQTFSQLLMVNALSFLCVREFGLPTTARYGISIQLFTIAAGLASVWSSVKWPKINQLRFQKQFTILRSVIISCIRRQTLTYLLLSATALIVGTKAISTLGSSTSLLEPTLLWIIALNQFLEMKFSFWTMLLATENKIPSLWPAAISNLSTIALAYSLVALTNLDVIALVMAPLAVGLAFNYWYWMRRGLLTIRVNAMELLLPFLRTVQNRKCP